ncbi:hypothetical protein PGT21_033618 [Puccinia graminis f. sp. tritici]|uniref:Secreted protein n=1 Tax=Puccinia graminis f. sp. tritici TaxID=56615 RepID=A0A5B0R2G3_PUCGR|nr:hypothetical protein PGTUg99_029141 [Puccinia graminis f. sp. tritici]KAA1119762.1 hypothetical protein PGT21_033618 [Puccinia graminis f. sp. tritici]
MILTMLLRAITVLFFVETDNNCPLRVRHDRRVGKGCFSLGSSGPGLVAGGRADSSSLCMAPTGDVGL